MVTESISRGGVHKGRLVNVTTLKGKGHARERISFFWSKLIELAR